MHLVDERSIERIIKQLTRELLSHDYVISRREARSIGLPIIDATEDEAKLMWSIYEDIAHELSLDDPWNWEKELLLSQPRSSFRAVIESYQLKHVFTSCYQIIRTTPSAVNPSSSLHITPIEEGSWK